MNKHRGWKDRKDKEGKRVRMVGRDIGGSKER